MQDVAPTIPFDPTQEIKTTRIMVEALLLLASIQPRVHAMMNCAQFAEAVRNGYRDIAKRTDLERLAEKGTAILMGGGTVEEWLWGKQRDWEAACRFFATVARWEAKSALSNAEIADLASSRADFYARYPVTSEDTPENIRHFIQFMFSEVIEQIPHLRPDATACWG